MYKNILKLRKISLPICAALAWISSQHFSQSKTSDPPQTPNTLTKTFIWGNGKYQAKPETYIQFKNFEPKLIETFLGEDKINMKRIYFGEFHEAGIDINGNAFIWRKHSQPSSKEKNINDNERKNVNLLDDSKEVVQIAFTKGYVWTLRKNGNIFQWPISVKYDEEYDEVKEVSLGNTARQITSLSNIKQIATGNDHFVALTHNGEVWTMGDDTYGVVSFLLFIISSIFNFLFKFIDISFIFIGQCGLSDTQRSTSPPFFEQRVRKPQKIQNIPPIIKIIAGSNHSLALAETGNVYGWGSNSNMQLSNQQEFSAVENPLIAVYTPRRISTNLSDNFVEDFAAGDEFSIFVTKNKINNETEVFGCGHNLHGELGLGFLKHVSDISKIESLSNYKIKNPDGTEKDIRIKEISCGFNHCVALLSIGVVMEWGANEYGQLGNKKRAFSENPLIVNSFAKENVLNISCGFNNSAVITENEKSKEQNKK